jgi:hypothetical protein
VHGAPLDPREMTMIDGVPVTSLHLPCSTWPAHCRSNRRFDGKIKSGRLLKPGQRIENVIFDEKLREDTLRDLGWQIVRWLWRDLNRRGVLRERVLRAFARAS